MADTGRRNRIGVSTIATLLAVLVLAKEVFPRERDTDEGTKPSITDVAAENADRIQPYPKNPYYWQYKGQPVLLLGGSKDDSLFQIPDLKQHLDDIQAAGGNYIRNTMSDRHDFDFEVYAFKKHADGKYDLNQWNEEYWRRFENLLRWTYERDIIVQIEVWDRFDYTDHRKWNNWNHSPWNPANNVNYTSEQSGLAFRYSKYGPGRDKQPFFHTIPGTDDYQARYDVLRDFQTRFVDNLLSHSLKYGHVLYCMDNETTSSPEWGKYWSNRIRTRAREARVSVQTTEMWDRDHGKPKIWEDPMLQRTFHDTDVYSYIDISQNNSQSGQLHWDNLQWARAHFAARPRPINNIKIYGGPLNLQFTATAKQGVRRFWRNIVGGSASSRFHRPGAGIGLTDEAKTQIKSMRLLTAELDVFRSTPDADSSLLSDNDDDEAYLTYIAGEQYVLYFPDRGSVEIDLSEVSGACTLKWLDIIHSKWNERQTIQGGGLIRLTTPDNGPWAVVITVRE